MKKHLLSFMLGLAFLIASFASMGQDWQMLDKQTKSVETTINLLSSKTSNW